MKNGKGFLYLAAAVAAGSTVYADKLTLEQTPPAVQNVIRAKAGANRIEDIDRDVRNGQVTYEASWKSSGIQQELLLSEAGTILRDVAGPGAGLATQNLTLANKTGVALTETPPAVQNAIRTQLQNAPIDYIQRGIWNGRNIYEITYHQDGRLLQTQVTEAGQPVVANSRAFVWQPRYAGVSEENVQLSGGQKMAFQEAPQAVQTTVTRMADGARVEDFERGTWNGRTVYEAAFKQSGTNTELQVFEDGSLVRKAPVATTASTSTTSPAPSQTQPGNKINQFRGRGRGFAGSSVQISNGSQITLTEAPVRVQQTVNRISKGARLDTLVRGEWNGRTVYQAAFQENGQSMALQVMEDGSILSGPASAAGGPAQGVIGIGRQ